MFDPSRFPIGTPRSVHQRADDPSPIFHRLQLFEPATGASAGSTPMRVVRGEGNLALRASRAHVPPLCAGGDGAGGVPLPAGAMVRCMLGMAYHDPVHSRQPGSLLAPERPGRPPRHQVCNPPRFDVLWE
jgi:hypothetical protein